MRIAVDVYLWLSESWRDEGIGGKVGVILLLLLLLIVLLLVVWLIWLLFNPQPVPTIHLNGSCQHLYQWINTGKSSYYEEVNVCP